MKKQKANTTQQTIGLDIGFGETKAIINGDSVIFPSVSAHARQIKFRADEISAKYPGDRVTDEQGDWFVGDLALSQIREGEILRLRGRSIDEGTGGNVFRLRMMKTALGKLFAGTTHGGAIHMTIATGLPVDHMPDASILKEMMIGQHLIDTDQSSFVANVTDVILMPQPYGTIYRQMLTPRGDMDECYTHSRTGVLDVGRFTVDITLDDEGEYIDSMSGSAEAGVYVVHDAIASAYERNFRAKPRHGVIDHILRTGCLRIRGEAIDYRHEVKEALQPLKDATLNLLGEKWHNATDIDVIWVSGGGATLVFDEIKRAYPQAQLVTESQLANAQGYLNFALFRQANGTV